MAKKEVIYEKRGFSLFGILFKSVIYSAFLIVSFIAGGLFLNDSFRAVVKSNKYYKKVLSYDYFNKLDQEAKPKPKIVEKEVKKIVKKIIWKTPKKKPVGYKKNQPTFGIGNFKKVDKLTKIENKRINNKNIGNGNTREKSLFEKVRDQINSKNNEDKTSVSKNKSTTKIIDTDSKASLNIDRKKVAKLVKENQIEIKNTPIKGVKEKEPERQVKKKVEVKEKITIGRLEPEAKKLIESKTKVAKLNPINQQKLIYNLSKFKTKYDLDPIFLTAIMMKESSLNPEAVSVKGKLGIFQIHPLKAKKISDYSKVELRKGVSLLDIDYNMALGVGYINFLSKMFKGNKKHILTAYYMGIENFINAAKNKIKLSSDVIEYRDEVLGMYKEWSKEDKTVKKIVSKNKKVENLKPKVNINKRKKLSNSYKSRSKIRDPFKTKQNTKSKKSNNSRKSKLPKIQIVN